MDTMSSPIKVFHPGQYLFKEGEVSKSLFLIKKGSVGIRKMKGGAFVELARLYTNEVVGELSFFDRQPRSAAAVALNEVEVLEITFESLEKVYHSMPDYLKTIMASVADRLRKADDMIRKLQKNVITEEPAADLGPTPEETAASNAEDLAAALDIDVDSSDEPK
jgi:CRP/FNR family cyclic AMP-dependent transcriptional regulator